MLFCNLNNILVESIPANCTSKEKGVDKNQRS